MSTRIYLKTGETDVCIPRTANVNKKSISDPKYSPVPLFTFDFLSFLFGLIIDFFCATDPDVQEFTSITNV